MVFDQVEDAVRAANDEDDTLHIHNQPEPKKLSVKDYIMMKIKELDRYSVDVNCHTVEVIAEIDNNGEYVRFEDIIHLFNKS